MDHSTQEQSQAPSAEAGAGGAKRERSRIQFPYLALDEALDVANAMYSNVALGHCEDDQLAAWLKLSPKSSGYRVRISTAKMFGLIDSPSTGKYRLTDLGQRIVDPDRQAAAKSDAFLMVPLFDAVHERFRGAALPPAAALEREFRELGVAEKQTNKARWAFERSAQSAGYFNQGRDRLVRPGFAGTERQSTPEASPAEPSTAPEVGSGDGGNGTRHPFVQGLLQTLPDPDTVWAIEGRVAWLKAAATCFDLIYRGNGTITIEGQGSEIKTAEEIV